MTNGTLFNENNVSKIVNNVDFISISIDGYDRRSSDFIRGNGTFDKVMRAISLLKSNGFEKISISATIPVMNKYFNEAFKVLAKELNVFPMPRALSYAGRAIENYDEILGYYQNIMINEDTFAKCDSLMGEIAPNLYPRKCSGGITSLTIDSCGDVFPCGALSSHEYVLGNIKDISDLLEFVNQNYNNNVGYKNLITLYPINNPFCIDCEINLFCSTCPAYHSSAIQKEHIRESLCSRKEALTHEIWG